LAKISLRIASATCPTSDERFRVRVTTPPSAFLLRRGDGTSLKMIP